MTFSLSILKRQEDTMLTDHLELQIQLKSLKLASIREHAEQVEQIAIAKNYSYTQYLSHLCQLEIDSRQTNRLKRWIKESRLPKYKTLSNFGFNHIPNVKPEQINALAETDTWTAKLSERSKPIILRVYFLVFRAILDILLHKYAYIRNNFIITDKLVEQHC